MAHSKIEVATPLPFSRPHVVFHFEDPSGQPVGEATAEAGFPAQYTLLDENRTTVLVLDAVRAQGLRFDFLLHDGRGAALGSLEMRRGSWGPKGLSAWGRKFAVAIGGKEVMALTSNPTGSLFQLVDLNSGSVLASASTKWAVTTARTQIEIAEAFPVDHRVVLGAFLMLSYTASGLR